MITLPARIHKWVASKATDVLLDTMGNPVEDISAPKLDLFLFEIPTVLKILIFIPIVLLVLAWLGWAVYTTQRLLRNEILHTTERILAYSDGIFFESPLNEIQNAIIERSIWGRLLGYGNIHITAKNGSVTVRSIVNPDQWQASLWKLSDHQP